MTSNNWKVSFDRQFKIDANNWRKKVDTLQVELQSIIDYILEYSQSQQNMIYMNLLIQL